MKEKTAKKRTFLILLGASLMLLAAVGFLLIFVTVQSQSLAALYIHIIEIALICAVFALALTGVLVMAFSLMWDRSVSGPLGYFLTKAAMALYPVAMWFGKMFRMSGDTIRASFIEINNQLVKNSHFRVPADKLLVLLPHCLQHSDCEKKLVGDSARCIGCGRCEIYEINALCKRLGVNVAVVTGGTLARKITYEMKPKAIVAVACERDLFSGIVDVKPLPAIGVVNMRPEGPCHNTRVDMQLLEKAIRQLIKEPSQVKA